MQALTPSITSPGVRAAWDKWIAQRKALFASVGMGHPDLEPISDICALAMLSKADSPTEYASAE
jgi:hypothetical protein